MKVIFFLKATFFLNIITAAFFLHSHHLHLAESKMEQKHFNFEEVGIKRFDVGDEVIVKSTLSKLRNKKVCKMENIEHVSYVG